ncbi:hypothetical protein M758_6G173800 [Ceratodon purpureus]|nr:hypothetical protein M758_6G173800 [Ceratodon purpureus]
MLLLVRVTISRISLLPVSDRSSGAHLHWIFISNFGGNFACRLRSISSMLMLFLVECRIKVCLQVGKLL